MACVPSLATLAAVKISPEQIRHVATLARLALTEEEEHAMTETLDAILTYIDKLDEIDTTEVEPTAHVLDLGTRWREDVVTNHPDTEALLANAPAREDDLVRVPRIIE